MQPLVLETDAVQGPLASLFGKRRHDPPESIFDGHARAGGPTVGALAREATDGRWAATSYTELSQRS